MPPPSLPLLPALVVAPLWLLGPGCGRPATPREGPLATGRPAADFGAVFEGALLAHEWVVEVAAPVSVKDVRTDCGCTLARLERDARGERRPYELGTALAPGERLRVSATYDTRGRRGASVRAVSLDYGGGVLGLSLAADVRPWLVAEPQDLAFARVREGEGAECRFRVRSVPGERYSLAATRRALPPWIEIELVPVDPDASARAAAWDVRVALAPTAPRGTYAYPIDLESDVPVPDAAGSQEPRTFALAPVWSVQVAGPVALSRPTLEFGLVRADQTVAQSVRVESLDPGHRLDGVRARLEPLRDGEAFPLAKTAHVFVHPGGDACDVELVLAGLDRDVAGSFAGRLVVETGHPGIPRLEALVRGVSAPAEVAR